MELSEIGVTEAKKKQFLTKNIETVEDLLMYIPYRYERFLKIEDFSTIQNGDKVLVKGIVKSVSMVKTAFIVKCVTDAKESFSCVFFGAYQYHAAKLQSNKVFWFRGVVNLTYSTPSITVPEYSENELESIKPIYSVINKMSYDYLTGKIEEALKDYDAKDLDELIHIEKYTGITIQKMLETIHHPKDENDILWVDWINAVRYLYPYAEKHMDVEKIPSLKQGFYDEVDSSFLSVLPFKLTDGEDSQISTINGLYGELKKDYATESIVQGDVASGKTMIALACAYNMAKNGAQTVLMCPTKILAEQHYENASKLAENLGLNVTLVNIDAKVAEKRKVFASINSGEADLIIGTSGCLNVNLDYPNLGLVIVDEEHRFGIHTKNALSEKYVGCHKISMSATLIPKTMLSVLYGNDTKCYCIRKKPAIQKPIVTTQVSFIDDIKDDIVREISNGHQVYVLCPLVKTNDNIESTSVEEAFNELKKMFPTYSIGMLHGQMTKADQEKSMEDFKNNLTNILVCTTIVEVGVNVPNASIMVIKNAERFGLAQMHQLRGRVGRGEVQGYCYVVSTQDKERLNIFCSCNDGFTLTEKDIELRGKGHIFETNQSGSFKVTDYFLESPDVWELLISKVSKRH